MATDNLHGAQGITELCGRLGPGWSCDGTETSTGFFMELLKTNSTTFPPSPRHCSSFLLAEEQRWRLGTRAFLYALGLLYCFLGLAVITGVYMKALDRIVKHTRKTLRRDPVTGITIFREEKIWNATVADVTLLALGTCAPQVSLAVIDAVQHLGESSGDELGAGTLLGSTAFNLFPILAVCVVAPKRFQIKSIRNVGVYVVEVAWSFWAYVWLFLILQVLFNFPCFSSLPFMLQVWTPEEITLWEAVVTVIQFPLLVFHAYIQDRNWKYLSLPLKPEDRVVSTSFEELTTISQSSKYAARYNECSDSSFNKSNLPFSDGSSDVFGKLPSLCQAEGGSHRSDGVTEDVDTRSRDSQTFLRETGQGGKLSWKELRSVWRSQFHEAMSVTGAGDERKLSPSASTLLLHPFVSYWKVTFAFIPPVELFHGWITFIGSIAFITWISFVLIELSNHFDCVTGFNSYVLALTILATGTSFPNLIASKIAAEEYETADSAIANINASNCINVFVGFGVPWCISSIYSTFFQQKLIVPAHGLGFILSVYFATAITCIVALTTRRRLLGGELGGPRRWAWISAIFFLLLWAIFLTFACLVDKFT